MDQIIPRHLGPTRTDLFCHVFQNNNNHPKARVALRRRTGVVPGVDSWTQSKPCPRQDSLPAPWLATWFTVTVRTSGSREIKHGNGPVTVHDDPPLRRHCGRQPATPLGWRDAGARRQQVESGAGQGQEIRAGKCQKQQARARCGTTARHVSEI